MSDNLIERLRRLTFIDETGEAADALEAKDKRFEEMSQLYQGTLNKNLEQAKRIEHLEAALREIVATKHYTQPMQYAHKIAKLALGEKE